MNKESLESKLKRFNYLKATEDHFDADVQWRTKGKIYKITSKTRSSLTWIEDDDDENGTTVDYLKDVGMIFVTDKYAEENM